MEDYIAPLPTQEYKVVIECFTYNQEQYIEDALKGFVRQKTNFPYCAIVVDDHSTDHNAEIIKKYEEKYPEIIKGIYLPYNMYRIKGGKAQYTKPWEEKAQYIAYCEGDDYWIDDYKLQRQVDFLDAHPDYTMCFHNALFRYQAHDYPDRLMSNFETGDIDTTLLFKHWQLPLASVVFRKDMLYSETYQKLSGSVGKWDFTLFVTACMTGKVYGIAECLSVYRRSIGSVSATMSIAYCEKLNWQLAVASGDNGAMKIVKKNMVKFLCDYVPNILIGDSDGIEMLKVANEAVRFLFVRALFRFIVLLPQRTVKKIRKTINGRKH